MRILHFHAFLIQFGSAKLDRSGLQYGCSESHNSVYSVDANTPGGRVIYLETKPIVTTCETRAPEPKSDFDSY
jgi:hypothetical protein